MNPQEILTDLNYTNNIEESVRFATKANRRNISKTHRYHAAKISYYYACKAQSQANAMHIASGGSYTIYNDIVSPCGDVRKNADELHCINLPTHQKIQIFSHCNIQNKNNEWLLPRHKRKS